MHGQGVSPYHCVASILFNHILTAGVLEQGVKNAGREIKVLYVAPQDLRIPANDKQWEDSLDHVVVP